MDIDVKFQIDENVLHAAVDFAARKGINIHQLANFLLEKAVASGYSEIEEFPIADWIRELDEANGQK